MALHRLDYARQSSLSSGCRCETARKLPRNDLKSHSISALQWGSAMAEATREKAGSEGKHQDPVSGWLLRPCPFCGSSDVCVICGIGEPAFVMCNKCRAFGPSARTANFTGSYQDMWVNCFNWIVKADETKLTTASGLNWVRDNSVCRPPANFQAFKAALKKCWER
jgi:hypothetical protein